jgi:hypothetical protein
MDSKRKHGDIYYADFPMETKVVPWEAKVIDAALES